MKIFFYCNKDGLFSIDVVILIVECGMFDYKLRVLSKVAGKIRLLF